MLTPLAPASEPYRWPGVSGIAAVSFRFDFRSKGAIGFDWVTISKGGVPWLISWPRKKLIKKQLPLIGSTHWSLKASPA